MRPRSSAGNRASALALSAAEMDRSTDKAPRRRIARRAALFASPVAIVLALAPLHGWASDMLGRLRDQITADRRVVAHAEASEFLTPPTADLNRPSHMRRRVGPIQRSSAPGARALATAASTGAGGELPAFALAAFQPGAPAPGLEIDTAPSAGGQTRLHGFHRLRFPMAGAPGGAGFPRAAAASPPDDMTYPQGGAPSDAAETPPTPPADPPLAVPPAPPLAAPGAVPEPAAWAMMVLGFGALGARLRARRPTSAS